MPKLKLRSTHLIILLLTAGSMLPALSYAQKTQGEITVTTEPLNIGINQPFKLIFSINGSILGTGSEAPVVANPQTNNFTLLRNLGTSTSTTYTNGNIESQFTCTYIMVPKHAGNWPVMPWRADFGKGGVLVSDTTWIQVSNERVSAKDSMKAENASNDFFAEFFDVTGTKVNNVDELLNRSSKSTTDSVYFTHPDSIYTAMAWDTFVVSYAITLVNKSDKAVVQLKKDCQNNFRCPEGIVELSQKWLNDSSISTVIINGKTTNHDENTWYYNLTLSASKSGTYTIPPLPFKIDGKKYVAHKVKVVVKE